MINCLRCTDFVWTENVLLVAINGFLKNPQHHSFQVCSSSLQFLVWSAGVTVESLCSSLEEDQLDLFMSGVSAETQQSRSLRPHEQAHTSNEAPALSAALIWSGHSMRRACWPLQNEIIREGRGERGGPAGPCLCRDRRSGWGQGLESWIYLFFTVAY